MSTIKYAAKYGMDLVAHTALPAALGYLSQVAATRGATYLGSAVTVLPTGGTAFCAVVGAVDLLFYDLITNFTCEDDDKFHSNKHKVAFQAIVLMISAGTVFCIGRALGVFAFTKGDVLKKTALVALAKLLLGLYGRFYLTPKQAYDTAVAREHDAREKHYQSNQRLTVAYKDLENAYRAAVGQQVAAASKGGLQQPQKENLVAQREKEANEAENAYAKARDIYHKENGILKEADYRLNGEQGISSGSNEYNMLKRPVALVKAEPTA